MNQTRVNASATALAAFDLSTLFWPAWKLAADGYYAAFARPADSVVIRSALIDEARVFADVAVYVTAMTVALAPLALAPLALRVELAAAQTVADEAWAHVAWAASWGRLAAA
jgi:hypothetical protein